MDANALDKVAVLFKTGHGRTFGHVAGVFGIVIVILIEVVEIMMGTSRKRGPFREGVKVEIKWSDDRDGLPDVKTEGLVEGVADSETCDQILARKEGHDVVAYFWVVKYGLAYHGGSALG